MYVSYGVLPSSAFASAIAALAASQFLAWMASWAALSGLPTFAEIFS
jgi:hypothetical protein